MATQLFATCVAGLEFVVQSEIEEKIPTATVDLPVESGSGKVFFTVCSAGEAVAVGPLLQAPENLYVLVCRKLLRVATGQENLALDKEAGLKQLEVLAVEAPEQAWDIALTAWKANGGEGGAGPTFCVRAWRRATGKVVHGYNHVDVERHVGAGVVERFGWKADLKTPEIDVYADLINSTVVLGVGLLREPLYFRGRNLDLDLGATPLRRSTCYAMIRLADPQPGEVFVDNMCGSGSLPFEGGKSFAGKAELLGGDISAKDIGKAAKIRAAGGTELNPFPVDLNVWDSCRLPLRAASVDAFVSDFPFGRRHGSAQQNQSLYPRALREMARVTRPGTGRAVILTMGKQVMKVAMANVKQFWKQIAVYEVLVGGGVHAVRHGMLASLFFLQRTDEPLLAYSKKSGKKRKQPGSHVPKPGAQGGGGKKKNVVVKNVLHPNAMTGILAKKARGTEAADKFMKENQFADAQTAYADRAAALSLAGGGGADAALLASWCQLKESVCFGRLGRPPEALVAADAALATLGAADAAAVPTVAGAEKPAMSQTAKHLCACYLQMYSQHGEMASQKGAVLWNGHGLLADAADALERALQLNPESNAATHKLREIRKRIEIDGPIVPVGQAAGQNGAAGVAMTW